MREADPDVVEEVNLSKPVILGRDAEWQILCRFL